MLKRNVAANALSKLGIAALSLLVIPFYLHLLGIEAYGLIGFYLTLASLLSLLDCGLGTTLNRRFAQLSEASADTPQMRNLLRTFEAVYWLIGIAIGALIMLAAPLIAGHWVNPQKLSASEMVSVLAMMGVALACQWPLALYSAGLMGLQRQVLASALALGFAALRALGAVAVLWWIAPSLEVFFGWHIAVGLAETLAHAIALWLCLSGARTRAAFSVQLLKQSWRFAAGVAGISALAVILTQLDKIILSKVLPLDAFGYYSVAWRVALGLYYLSSPVNAAFFPRLSQLAANAGERELARVYHDGCQLLTVLVVPVSLVLAFFPHQALLLWTTDNDIAASSASVLRLIVIGTALNALMSLPLALQLAHGWTRLVFATNALAVALLAPALYWASLNYGAIGAAWVWIALNTGYVIFLVPAMHRRLLPGHLGTWLATDVGTPLLAGVSVIALWRYAFGIPQTLWAMAFDMALVSMLTVTAVAFAAPRIRTLSLQYLRRIGNARSGIGS